MLIQWKQLSTQNGIQRYQAANSRATAWIKHNENGSAESGSKHGLFGLGLHTDSFYSSPAPSDSKMLQDIDDLANPPRFKDWTPAKQKCSHTTEYKGKADNIFNSTVKASITRIGDEAHVHAKVGLFGTEIDGHFFAPAPSDTEIISRISKRY